MSIELSVRSHAATSRASVQIDAAPAEPDIDDRCVVAPPRCFQILGLALAVLAACGTPPDREASGDDASMTSADVDLPDEDNPDSGEHANVGRPDVGNIDARAPSPCPDGFAEVSSSGCVAWEKAAHVSGRWRHGTVRLDDGRILTTGGIYADDPNVGTPSDLDSAQIYDASADTWTDAASLPNDRFAHTATLLPDGRVLVAGGDEVTPDERFSALFYDPAADAWSAAPALLADRSEHGAVGLAGGEVFVYGGWGWNDDISDSVWSDTAEIFDPVTEEWRAISARGLLAAVPLSDGTVATISGSQAGDGNSVAVFDPTDESWRDLATMTYPRDPVTTALLPGDDLLVVGDGSGGSTSLTTAEIYRSSEDVWTILELPYDWYQGTATVLEDGRVLLASYHDDFPLHDAGPPLLLDPMNETITELPGEPTIGRDHHAIRVDDHSVLFVGGWQSGATRKGGLADVTVFRWEPR